MKQVFSNVNTCHQNNPFYQKHLITWLFQENEVVLESSWLKWSCSFSSPPCCRSSLSRLQKMWHYVWTTERALPFPPFHTRYMHALVEKSNSIIALCRIKAGWKYLLLFCKPDDEITVTWFVTSCPFRINPADQVTCGVLQDHNPIPFQWLSFVPAK